MQRDPFPLFHSFEGLDIRLMTREDNVSSDADFSRCTEDRPVVGLRQAHGNTAVVVREKSSREISADAVATDRVGLALSIRFADCQNAVIYAPKERVICLVHAGWKGVKSRIATSAYTLLREEWGIAPKDTWVGLGPALCKACAEFTDPAVELPELQNFADGRLVDLRAALDAELANIGVLQSHIERLPDCTRCHPDQYFTYRGGDKEKVQNGFVNGLTVTLL